MTKFKPWKIVAIILAALLLAFLVWKLVTKPEAYFKTTKIEYNHIFNLVKEKPYLDTLVYSGLINMGIKDAVVVIRPMTEKIRASFPDEILLNAKIIGENKTFVIWVDSTLAKSEYFTTLAHELIHLEQYYTKMLAIHPNSTVTWKGEIFNVENTPENYNSRPWEKAANDQQNFLKRQMIITLYGE